MFSANCRKRVADWMQRLHGEGVRDEDLVFACVGGLQSLSCGGVGSGCH